MKLLTMLALGVAFLGFVLGLFVSLKVVLRIAIGVLLLCGLGLVLANYGGADELAYAFGVGMAGAGLAFAVALLGAAAAALVRRLMGIEPEEERREREYNSIIQ